jgi:hypothetical protein
MMKRSNDCIEIFSTKRALWLHAIQANLAR